MGSDSSLIPAVTMHSLCAGRSQVIDGVQKANLPHDVDARTIQMTTRLPRELHPALHAPAQCIDHIHVDADPLPVADYGPSQTKNCESQLRPPGPKMACRTHIEKSASKIVSNAGLEPGSTPLNLAATNPWKPEELTPYTALDHRDSSMAVDFINDQLKPGLVHAPSFVSHAVVVTTPNADTTPHIWPLSHDQIMTLPPPTPPPDRPLPPLPVRCKIADTNKLVWQCISDNV